MAALIGWSYTSSVILFGIMLFFIIAIVNKWLNMVFPFNQWLGFAGGLIPYFAIAYMWALKPALGIGLVGALVAGVFGGMSMGGTESDN